MRDREGWKERNIEVKLQRQNERVILGIETNMEDRNEGRKDRNRVLLKIERITKRR